jgi:hypothetical protein
MSSPILPVPGLSSPTSPTGLSSPSSPTGLSSPSSPTAPATTAIGDVSAFIAQLAAGVGALSVRDARCGPPPELREQIDAARRIGEQLRERGFELRFFTAAERGSTTIEIHDRAGNAVGELSAAEALQLASDGPTD